MFWVYKIKTKEEHKHETKTKIIKNKNKKNITIAMEYFEGEFDKNIVESKNIIQQIKMERKTKKNNVQNYVINKPDKLKILKTKLKNAKKYLR